MQHHNTQRQMKLLTYFSSSNCWHAVMFAFAFALLMHCVARKKMCSPKQKTAKTMNKLSETRHFNLHAFCAQCLN